MLHTNISIIFTPEWRVGKHIYAAILYTYCTVDIVKRQMQKSETRGKMQRCTK
jgi:hypothetical protein